MRLHAALLSASIAILSTGRPFQAQQAVPERAAARQRDPAKEKRLEWFRDAKYGLFIHWGLYAVPAGEWKGQRSLGLGEWIMFRSRIPLREYETLAPRFNPVRYNADEWVKLAKDAGMKYIVI